ncbi:[acyl-carrier-protein] S-malonyltransferase [Corallococcus sp. H22C18031201]|uniref:ACP S-malonyltransferase n=1 Tax=Citreicoccus inhibens TaxID=2849499 RepID=UPI000E71D187|nr:ACP S-malonyltransferase [Citreicoccus inhibens]MBU8896965.1 ACP S-malonyltransferase [Citreicoccus inhibens]RJS20857.1 [acyl-carrier-protein] S-malonyltransferase [Corallococcus sp. H22C18031201]
MRIHVFPGQGSQHVGMGAELFDSAPEEVAAADAVLGWSVRALCLEDRDQRMNQTAWTQPALYVVNALSYLKKVRETGQRPELVAGHSLGEYNALFAAGAFDFVTGLRLVQRRAAVMAKARNGGMAAVVGLSASRVRDVLHEEHLDMLDLANLNAPEQQVLSGPVEALSQAESVFTRVGVRGFKRLAVSAAFHSRYMGEARREFESFLAEFVLSSPRIPVISNVEAQPYPPGALKRLLVEQITAPVRWEESVQHLLRQSAADIEEVGPGRVLTTLIAQIRRKVAS